MNKRLALFLARLFSNESSKLFTVRLGVYVLLGKFGITGLLADFIGLFFRNILGLFIEFSVLKIDLVLDTIKEGMKEDKFRVLATKAYAKATAKVYDEQEKEKIRKEYLDIISGIGIIGNPK